MSDNNNIGDVLTRVEQMLDALESPAQSSAAFKAGCDSLQAYLNDQAGVFAAVAALSEQDKTRVASVVERLAKLQKQAETKAAIPTELQKYIAEQLD
jgi:beta-glucosidase-like glycosyl hydrolase